MKINIIDTTSTEFNRGSFCYAPYLCYNGLTDMVDPLTGLQINEVTLMEGFQSEDLDRIPDADVYIVTLWSYPQIEPAMLLAHMIPFEKGNNAVFFVGYRPLIEHLGLRYIDKLLGFDPLVDPDFLRAAMRTYPKNYSVFKRLLLSDCDMHIKHLEKGKLVHPLFTSYGCPNGCAFCPSTKNCNKSRIELSLEDTYNLLDECIAKDIKYIHFTDEDFFFDIDRAYQILCHLDGKGMHLIALSSAKAAWDFIDKYGVLILKDAGLEVMEVGFESAAESVSGKMGVGKSLTDCEKLAAIQHTLPFSIFWLVLTFFPGETITSLNETGVFLQTYGFEEAEVVGRLRTNGTVGGLGQYFQPYHGLGLYKTLEKNGMFLTERPIRLIPSYVPNTFLDSIIKKINPDRFDSALPWLRLYNIQFDYFDLTVGRSIREYVMGKPMYQKMKLVTTFAILARMEVIE